MELVRFVGVYLLTGVIAWLIIIITETCKIIQLQNRNKELGDRVDRHVQDFSDVGWEVLGNKSEAFTAICKMILLWPGLVYKVYTVFEQIIQQETESFNQEHKTDEGIEGDS